MAKTFNAKAFKAELILEPRSSKDFVRYDSNPLMLAGRIINRVRAALSEYGCKNRDKIIAAAKDAFFAFCDATDIPLVPAIAETQIEQNLWDNYIAPTLESIANTVCGAKPTITRTKIFKRRKR